MKDKSLIEKHIKDMQGRIARLRESAKKPEIPSIGLARLIESEIDKSEAVINARAISTKLQDMVEDVLDLQGKRMLELIMKMKESFGPDFADQFKGTVSQTLTGLMAQVEQAKDTIDNEVIRMERIVNGEPANDMAMDGVGMEPELDAEADLGDELPGEEMDGADVADMGDELGDEAGPEMADIDAALADAGATDDGAAAGRARKESFLSDKAILEAFAIEVKGGAKPTKAAKVVAEKFDIDADDVRSIVKEASKS